MNKTALLIILFPLSVAGQANRYFISFKDKANTTYSVADPTKFLSQKSIDRRRQENFMTTEEDFPVNSSYVAQVKATGAKTYFTSRWFNGVLVQTDPFTAHYIIQALPFVSSVEYVAPGAKLIGGRKSASTKFETISNTVALINQAQLKMIGLDEMHAAGYLGEGVDVALFDDGFIGADTISGFKPLFNEGRIKAAFNFVDNTTNIYSADNHGTATLSILAGNTNTFSGSAYKANFFLYQTEDVFTEYRVEEYNWAFAAERADSAGVVVISSSLGYSEFDDFTMNYAYKNMDGKTTVVTRAARKAFERGISVVNAAGNEGSRLWRYIVAPADVDGVIACGGVDLTGTKASFSSVGPSADKRIKPDVSALAVGTNIFSTTGSVVSGSGTSFSCPLIAGLVAGLRQALPRVSAREIYTIVINSASQAAKPDNLLGYGIPNFTKAKNYFDAQPDFEIYPNPVASSDALKILFKDPQGQNVGIVVFNTAGQKVTDISIAETADNNPFGLDFSAMAAGLYFVKVQTPTTSKVLRVLRVN